MQWPILLGISTGLFWGFYAATLALARTAEKSPFKPYVMIGVAYLVWGVLGGLIGMKWKGDSFSFSTAGMTWGFVAGSLGAFGAFTLTLAMYTGGVKAPHLVTPFVFGTAVAVSAIVGVYQSNHSPSPWLWVGMAGLVASVCMVTYFTPHAAPPKPGGTPAPTQAAPPSH